MFMQIAYSKLYLAYFFFIFQPIFKMFDAHFTTNSGFDIDSNLFDIFHY